MNVRVNKPEAGNKFYNTVSNGGWSWCIVGNPTDSGCNVLSNCVGYACGRFNEIIGSMKYPQLNCNAENFIERAKGLGLKITQDPTVGGIMVWEGAGSLAGHVAVVERVIDKYTVYTSESGWGSPAFWNATRSNNNGRWGASANYKYIGCIVNPAVIEDNKDNDPFPGVKDEELARRVWAGEFGNGDVRKLKLGVRYNTVQKLVNQGVGRPNSNEYGDLLTLVRKTIRGDFGSGETRKKYLGDLYDEVQRQVNINLRNGNTYWNSIVLY